MLPNFDKMKTKMITTCSPHIVMLVDNHSDNGIEASAHSNTNNTDKIYKNILDNKRYNAIFNEIVKTYIETGEPVGSRCISKRLDNSLSPATIRNVMADLEEYGILCSQHTSSGRKPTDAGMKIFVDQIVAVDNISQIEKDYIHSAVQNTNAKNIQSILASLSDALSELTQCVSLIIVPTIDSIIKHIDFIELSNSRAIIVIVTEDGLVENRIINLPPDVSSNALDIARNYINNKISSQKMRLRDIQQQLESELCNNQSDVDMFVKDMIKNGICSASDQCGEIIIRGQSNILNNSAESRIDNINDIFKQLHEQETIKTILDSSLQGHGFKVFIGSESNIFKSQNCSMIVSPYKTTNNNLIGAIGVFGDYRMQYSKVITLVNYTADVLKSIV